MLKATDKLPEVELNLGFEYMIYYKQDRKKKKKVFKLHGKPFIRLKLFLLATEAFNTCNQRRLIKKLYDIPFKFSYHWAKLHQIWQFVLVIINFEWILNNGEVFSVTSNDLEIANPLKFS